MAYVAQMLTQELIYKPSSIFYFKLILLSAHKLILLIYDDNRVLLGRVPCLRASLLSGMALQLVLTSLLLSDAFVRALSMRHVISLVIF